MVFPARSLIYDLRLSVALVQVFAMRFASFIALIVLSLGVVAYAIVVYGFLPLGVTVAPDMVAERVFNRTTAGKSAPALRMGRSQP